MMSEVLVSEIAVTEKEISETELRLRQLRRKLKKLNSFLEEFSFSPSEPVTDEVTTND